jgi:hypothetical protein
VSGRGRRSLGGLDELSSQVVICLGVLQTQLAGQAGLIRAVGAHLGAVTLVIGGSIQSDQEGLDLAGWDEDGVLGGRFGRRRFRRRRRWLVDIRAERVVLGALVDVREVADEQDGPGGVRGVAAGVAASDEPPAGPLLSWSPGGSGMHGRQLGFSAFELWLWPLPPAETFEFAVEWPFGVSSCPSSNLTVRPSWPPPRGQPPTGRKLGRALDGSPAPPQSRRTTSTRRDNGARAHHLPVSSEPKGLGNP